MKRILATTVALAALSACGDGNPFDTTLSDDDADATVDLVIPEEISSALTSFTYDPTDETLSITGLQSDGDEATVAYNRRANLDRGEYQAYTFQDDPLDEHTTVYVREIGDVVAATAVTGGQFTFFSGGATFSRSGNFDPIAGDQSADVGLVTYEGDYVGLSDVTGPNTDLLAAPATDGALLPSQAAPVTGRVFINVEFDTGQTSGVVTNRVVESSIGDLDVPDLFFEPTQLDDDGYFSGTVQTFEEERSSVGSYAGVIGGTDSSELAGALYASDHYGENVVDGNGNTVTFEDEEEYGIFVLGRCGTNQPDHSTDCDVVDPE